MVGKNSDHFYVEKREDGTFAATRGGGQRASYTGATQREVLDQLREKRPGAPVHVERVRNTSKGSPDKWR